MAGLNLMQAIAMVGESGAGPVYSAFGSAGRDFAAGMTRFDVLAALRDRLGTRTAVSLVSSIRQAEVTGTPVVEVLSVHAEAARREEHAEKLRLMELVPLKLVVVTAVLLLPSVMIVSIVPHVISFIQSGW
jgi:pilus assembly protein TadC